MVRRVGSATIFCQSVCTKGLTLVGMESLLLMVSISNLDPWLLVGDLNDDQWMDLFHAIQVSCPDHACWRLSWSVSYLATCQETIFESYKSSGVSRRGADGVKRIGMYEGLDGEAGHYTDKLLVRRMLDDLVAR